MNFNGLSEATLRMFRLFLYIILSLFIIIMALSVSIMSTTFIILVGVFAVLTILNIVRLNKEIRKVHNKE